MSDAYTLHFSARATENLKHLDKSIAQRILNKLEWLAANAGVIAHVPLGGEWDGFYRLRMGDYRVIYRLDRDSRLLVVIVIGHRRAIYTD